MYKRTISNEPIELFKLSLFKTDWDKTEIYDKTQINL